MWGQDLPAPGATLVVTPPSCFTLGGSLPAGSRRCNITPRWWRIPRGTCYSTECICCTRSPVSYEISRGCKVALAAPILFLGRCGDKGSGCYEAGEILRFAQNDNGTFSAR